MHFFVDNAWLIPVLPLLGAIAAGALGPTWLRGRSHWPVIAGVVLAFVASAGLLMGVRQLDPAQYGHNYHVYDWISAGDGSWLTVSFRIDPLTAIMLVTVTSVSSLVVIYSRSYMRHHGDRPERGYERFFAYMGLFVFSMCVLVLAGNFLLLYLGWEAVGLCSYLLIGFYYERPAARSAAMKAFVVNRIGDFGFGLGVLLIYLKLGSLDYTYVFAHIGELGGAVATAIALLLFCGAIGKSAQIPLYVWLPDAMEGPSPVSALIHAATMVTAGVYMVARCGAIFVASEIALPLVASVGAVTALFAATIALAQYDMKRILAYSTISQLGYMFLALGAVAPAAAIFHLYTHAFFKALLFLGAGSVMHALAGVIDIRQFSGLRRRMPVTWITFVAGGLALAGFPLTAGFFSKDQIIHAAWQFHPVFGVLGLLTALLTAVYTFRMIFWAFWGPETAPEGVAVHESSRWMTVPLIVLAVGAVFAGYWHFDKFLSPVVEVTGHASHGHDSSAHGIMIASAVLAVVGIVIAWILYRAWPQLAQSIADRAKAAYQLLHNKYYVDEAYDEAIVQPLHGLGRGMFACDNYVIDGLLWIITAIPRAAAFLLREFQRGAVQGYALAMAIGVAAILIGWLVAS